MDIGTGGLHHSVLERLGPDLVWGDLRAVTDLRLELLAARYSVSRSVVREVVRVLESMGMVSSRRRVGVRVRPRADWNSLDPRLIRWRLAGPERAEQLSSISELRRAIEPVAAALAAERAGPEQCGRLSGAAVGMSITGPSGDLAGYLDHDITFHRALLQSSGNEMFAGLAEVVAEVLTGRTEHDLMPARPEPTAIRLHAEVAEAVCAHDAARAERAMRDIVTEAAGAMERSLRGAGS